jgi:TonB family protein
MTSDLWARDLVLYLLQSTLLIAPGFLFALLLRLREPKTMLGYWRAILGACLLLPALQPWRTAPPPVEAPTSVRAFSGAPTLLLPDSVAPSWRPQELLLLALCAGVVARGLWLVYAAVGVRRLRQQASPLLPVPDPVRRAERLVGISADVRVSTRISGPVTFGVRRPVILVPPGVLTLDESIQEAIVCHELLHVRRRDWLDQVVEEVLIVLFWFHPAVRWLIGRIQLTREQVVDRAAIDLTHAPERYVDALMAVALTQPRISFVPAPLFLRRRSLKNRIANLLQETTMSTRRLTFSFLASAAALAVVAVLSVQVFPLQARAQTALGAPVQIVAGGQHLIDGALPEYPGAAIEARVEGDVTVELTVNDRGRVSDARVISGPDELRKPALRAALDWSFSPAAVRSTIVQATIRFHLPAPGTRLDESGWTVARAEFGEYRDMAPAWDLKTKLRDAQRQLAEIQVRVEREQRAAAAAAVARPVTFDAPKVLSQIRSEGVADATRKSLLSQIGIQLGDLITEDIARRIRATAAQVDPHIRVEFESDGKGGIVLAIIAP